MRDLLKPAVMAALALIVQALAVQPAAARMNLFAADGTDPRVTVSSFAGPSRIYAPVAKVRTLAPVITDDGSSRATRGTGFLVSPCLLLTNFHAVFGHATYPIPDGPAVEIILTSAADQPLKTRATPVLWGAMGNAGRDDWALVRLDECIGGRADVGWYDLDPAPEEKITAYDLATAGFPGDRKGLAAHLSCRIHAVNGDHEALNDCANEPGASGSPLFHLGDGAAPAVVAIQRAQHGQRGHPDPGETVLTAYDPGYSNSAVPIARVLGHPEVMAMIAGDRAVYALDNPLLSPLPQPETPPAAAPETTEPTPLAPAPISPATVQSTTAQTTSAPKP